MKECGSEGGGNGISKEDQPVALKTIAGHISASKNIRGVPDTQESLHWTQGSLYTDQRENLH